MAVSLEENSCNEDAFATHHGQLGLTEPTFCSVCGNMVSSNVLNGQERFSLYNDGTTTRAMLTLTPNTIATVRRAEEMDLQSKLRTQRLEHQLYEEQLEHLIKVKQLRSELTTTPVDKDELSAVMTSASNGNVVGENNNLGPKMPILSPLEVELTKKLVSKRIQHQIEREDALHKLNMKQLNETHNANL